MPVYHFTYHAHGTWLPDHPRGYTKRHAKVTPPDHETAARYRAKMKQKPARFTHQIQKRLIEELQIACDKQNYRLHSVATDLTHLHTVVFWSTDRSWMRVRAGLQSSLTRRLNSKIRRRTWFVAHPSRKCVNDHKHLDYLIHEYHPAHRGWKWNAQRRLYL